MNNLLAIKVANAISSTMDNNLDSEEKLWVTRIEDVRSRLNASPTRITIPDYGAGEPERNYTESRMNDGVVITTTVSEASWYSKNYFWGLLLFKLVRELKPLTCIELGTCLGISTAYQAAAQKLNGRGRIISLEGAPVLASLAENNLHALGLNNVSIVCGRFQDTLGKILRETEPIDFAFVDGHHDENATISYFESLVPHLSEESVIIIDDITWSDGMRRAWESIIKNKCVKISIDLQSMGICILDNGYDLKCNLNIPMLHRQYAHVSC